MDSYRFTTVESGLDVLRKLYADTEDRIFAVTILVPVADSDTLHDVELELFITRKYHGPHIFEAVNGDRTYRTVARFSREGESFEIDVMIPHRESDTVGATILVSPQVNDVIRNTRQ